MGKACIIEGQGVERDRVTFARNSLNRDCLETEQYDIRCVLAAPIHQLFSTLDHSKLRLRALLYSTPCEVRRSRVVMVSLGKVS